MILSSELDHTLPCSLLIVGVRSHCTPILSPVFDRCRSLMSKSTLMIISSTYGVNLDRRMSDKYFECSR
jgi:hypothetical protein